MIISNKTIAYSIYNKRYGMTIQIPDTTEVSLPSVEYATDSISGGGILGEIDLPTPGQINSMELEISIRATPSEVAGMLDTNDLEIRWVSDSIDTSNAATRTVANKAFLKVRLKKFEEGKIANGESQDATISYEVLAYRRIRDGAEILNIDKLNRVFKINGIDQISDISNNL